jgi:hypothetical protein
VCHKVAPHMPYDRSVYKVALDMASESHVSQSCTSIATKLRGVTMLHLKWLIVDPCHKVAPQMAYG